MDSLPAPEAALLQCAAGHDFPALDRLVPGDVRQLTRVHGVDFATAVLFDRCRRAPRHAALIASVTAAMASPAPAMPAVDRKIAIVPGALYQERPDLGGDGGIVREAAAAFGVPVLLVPLASRGSVMENAGRLADWLRQCPDEKLVLVSLSKGGPDWRRALTEPDAASVFRPVLAWVNFCGPLDGTPVVDWVLDSRVCTELLKGQYRLQRRDFGFVTGLRRGNPVPFDLVPGMPLISIVGFPLRRHLTTPLSRFCHRIISRLGPNDGTVLLEDALRWPGELCPVWGADHYFRPESRARALLHAVFQTLAERPGLSSPRVP